MTLTATLLPHHPIILLLSIVNIVCLPQHRQICPIKIFPPQSLFNHIGNFIDDGWYELSEFLVYELLYMGVSLWLGAFASVGLGVGVDECRLGLHKTEVSVDASLSYHVDVLPGDVFDLLLFLLLNCLHNFSVERTSVFFNLLLDHLLLQLPKHLLNPPIPPLRFLSHHPHHLLLFQNQFLNFLAYFGLIGPGYLLFLLQLLWNLLLF